MSPASDHPLVKAASWKLKSSAVAIPAFAMTKVILIFYTVVMVVQKEEVKRINSAS
ncbi:hypothetical protein [Aeromonas salmonicida]|uniref:hypothetical protein n=1 Tax=Aeromonas salmonicida TaxID=645 RepID=UPI0031FD69EC